MTVRLPDDLRARLEAESFATGVSRAELVRRGVAMALDNSQRRRHRRELPVFDSGRSRTSDAMDDSVRERIEERAARR